MDDQKRINLYKEMYYFELKRKDQMNSSLTFPLAIIVGLFGFVAYYWENFPRETNGWCFWGFLIFFMVGAVCLGISVYCLIRSAHNYEYGYLPNPEKIEKYYKELKKFYTHKKNDLTKEDFTQFLKKQYCEHTKRNTKKNDTKSKYLHKTKKWLIISLISIMLSFIAYSSTAYMNPKAQNSQEKEGECNV